MLGHLLEPTATAHVTVIDPAGAECMPTMIQSISPCHSRMQALPKALGNKAKHHLEVLFDWALPACLRFLRKELQEISPTEDAGLARGAMRIIEACLDDFKEGALAG